MEGYGKLSKYVNTGIEMSGLKLLKQENKLDFNDINANVAQENCNIYGVINKNLNNNVLSNEIPQINSEDIEILNGMRAYAPNGVKGHSPEPIHLMPKPLNNKPKVPKNKPQIILRKSLNRIDSKTLQSSQIKRSTSEPSPPPLPKSPPPASPDLFPLKFESIFCGNSDSSSNSRNLDQETLESKVISSVPKDEYLSPISAETPISMDCKHSSNISKMSFNTRNGDSAVENFPSLSTQRLNKTSLLNKSIEDYELTLGKVNNYEISIEFDNKEENYEIVNDIESMNGNNLLPIGPRPLLPKAREITPKTKPITDIFHNWLNSPRTAKDKKIVKDEQDGKHTNEDNGNLFQNIDPVENNNSNLIRNSKRKSIRPPLPTLPQTNTLTANESLPNFKWFHNIEREDSEALLMKIHQNGSYLVRESERAGKSNPYALSVFHNGRVFHLNIRKRADRTYALGKEKPGEKTFKIVSDLINYHTIQPILLTTRGIPAGKTKLIMTPMS